MEQIGVIGAGIAGLAAAVRLQSKGKQVTVFEKNEFAGGKLSAFEAKGYRFDAGPSLFTMPHLVEELFLAARKDIKDYFSYQRLEVVCNYFWNDNTRFTAWADERKYANEMQTKFNIEPKICLDYFQLARKKYEATENTFIKRSLHKLSTYFNKDILTCIGAIPYLNIFDTMHNVNKKTFKNDKVVQLFDRYATYNGSNPYQASGILTMIPHLEQGIGTFLPKGGMHNISQSVYKLAQDIGVKFHLNSPVEEIILNGKKNKATGLISNGQAYNFDKIVCNMDVFFAYDKLLKGLKRPEKILSQEKSSSALIFYWGVKHNFSELDVHNIFFADDYEAEFNSIFNSKTIYNDPTVYINITSKKEAQDAPAEGENWFVMVNTPALLPSHDWENWINQMREVVANKLTKILNINILEKIETEQILDPRSIQSRTLSHLGALYGASSNDRNAAFLRHSNFSRQVKNLYFCGGSVHPGGGIPLCLSSAQIVADGIE